MPPDRILFLSNSEYGALNPMLAVCHEVLRLRPATEVHLAAFGNAEKPAKSAFQFATQCSPSAVPPVFHVLPGMSCSETLVAQDPGFWSAMGARLTLSTVHSCYQRMTSFLMPWEAADFLAIYRSIEELIRTLHPSIVVVDSVLSPGLSACKTLGTHHVVLSPNTLKELLFMFQPRAQGLWKYPATGSGYAFPVPWYLIPLNIYYTLALVFLSIFNSRTSRILRGIRASGDKIQILTVGDLSYQRPPGLKVLVSSRAESDLPLENIPADLITCGPISRAAPKLSDVDEELAQWLAQGPTVFINLGSLANSSEEDSLQMALSVRVLLEQSVGNAAKENLQILWKLKKEGDYSTDKGSRIYAILGRELEAGSVRITPWVNAEPGSILATGNVICLVNHGGANSYGEAVNNGVPQVVLPVWTDTYDFATRVEWLGIGRWGSPEAQPRYKAAELGPILVDVVLGPRAGEMRDNARKLARVCTKDGGGAAVAANEILQSLR